MAVAVTPKLDKNTVVKLKDGTAVTPVELELDCIQSWTSPDPTAEHLVLRCRGAVTHVLDGDDPVHDVTLNLFFYEHTNVTAGAVRDFVKQLNGYSANVSTNASLGYTIDVEMTTAAETGQTVAAVKTHHDCKLVSIDWTPGSPDAVALVLTCYGGITPSGQT